MALCHGAAHLEHADHGTGLARVHVDGLHQIHEPAALGIDWLATLAEGLDFVAHDRVG